MGYLSIRNLPLDLEKAIQQEVKKRKTSKSQVIIDALKEVFKLKKTSSKIQRNIRIFFGKMTPQEYKEFLKLTDEFSKIEEEMWK